MAKRVTCSEFNEKVLGYSGLSLVEFYSDSCVPCKRMSLVLSAIEERYPQGLYICKVNVAYEKELVEKYQIRATPTFLFFKNGEMLECFTGVRKKEELEQLIKRYI